MKSWIWLAMAMVMLGLSGCAYTLADRGRELLARQEYGQATVVLQQALAQAPDDAGLLVALAQAFYRQGELEKAQGYLEQALDLDPQNERAALVLGLVREARGDRAGAIEAYRNYSRMGRLSETRRKVEGHLGRLLREQLQEEIRKALAREELLDVAGVPDNAVAVAPFRNAGSDRALDPLQKGLAEMMVTDLSKVSRLQVVERLRMQEMMQEIGLGMTGAVDPATAPRLGKLLGAGRVVAGSFADLTGEQLRLDISVAGVKTGAVEDSQTEGPMEKLFRLQKELTFGLIGAMGIELTAEERDAIQQIPTENLLAFIAYSRGLDLEDRGEPEAAAAAFRQAVELDPGFGAAQEGVERAAAAASLADAGDLRQLEAAIFAAEQAAETQRYEVIDRLAATGARVGAGFVPTGEITSSEVREPVEEQETVDFGGERVEMEIVVPLP